MKLVDARGILCPQPVLMTKNAIKDSKEGVEVLVDNKAALGNVKRFLTKEGFSITIEEGKDEYKILGRR